ncbi:MAG: malto-oligosyltrehalose trehalohydrolase [Acidimicrobiales bacterium]
MTVTSSGGDGGKWHGGLGAVPSEGGHCSFVVWAPHATSVSVCLGVDDVRMVEAFALSDGYYRALAPDCPAGTRYRYRLDGATDLADPASRSQPDGVHGPSEVFDPGRHPWGDSSWVAPPLWRYVLYEMHVGTLTPGGTFDDAVSVLDSLVELGITAVEPMPVAQFAGRRNWGYDGVFPGAVQNSYGGPTAFQRFVDACHQRGLAVVLDVVYNHLGPEGNVFGNYGPYFTDRYRTPWGDAINFDGPGSDEVRGYFIENALGWFADFHVDALRLDAIHSIADATAHPFVTQLAEAVEDFALTSGRPCPLIAESADNDPRVILPREMGGSGLDAQWNDDFHHALHAVATGERTGYYADFGRLDQLARAVTDGFVYQGQVSQFRGRRHGAPSRGADPGRFVVFAQNHDHIGNRPRGDRLSTLVGFDWLRLIAAVVLLAPGIPLLFMGEEYGETAPFPYFVDHGDQVLIEAVRIGRAEELSGWADPTSDPAAIETFRQAVIDRSLASQGEHARLRRLHAALIAVRRDHPVLSRSRASEVVAQARGRELRMQRGTGYGAIFALFNFCSDQMLESVMPELPIDGAWAGEWVQVLDSADPAWGGPGQPLPRYLAGGADLCLSRLGFCVYECRPTDIGESSPSESKSHR